MKLNWLLRTGVISTALVLAGCGGGGGSGAQSPDGGPIAGGPAPGSDPASDSCGGAVSNCLDLAAPQITKYKDNKFAAASYTFDDGPGSSFEIADMFESRGLRATFYIVPGTVEAGEWASWRGLLQKGHEISNHSMTHKVDMGQPDANGEWAGENQTALATPEQLEDQINSSHQILSDRLGPRLMTFAFPWHSWTPEAYETAMVNHFDVRSREWGKDEYVFSFFDHAHEGTKEEQDEELKDPAIRAKIDAAALQRARTQLEQAVKNGHWFVAAGHGIYADPSLGLEEGWSPISKNFLETHLNDAVNYAPRLWVDTYLNVSRYLHCSTKLTPKVSNTASGQVSLSLEGNLSAKDSRACTEPLTVSLPLTKQNAQGLSAHDEEGKAVPLKQGNGLVWVDVKPGQQISLRVPA